LDAVKVLFALAASVRHPYFHSLVALSASTVSLITDLSALGRVAVVHEPRGSVVNRNFRSCFNLLQRLHNNLSFAIVAHFDELSVRVASVVDESCMGSQRFLIDEEFLVPNPTRLQTQYVPADHRTRRNRSQ
jgi:hypothetical protein